MVDYSDKKLRLFIPSDRQFSFRIFLEKICETKPFLSVFKKRLNLFISTAWKIKQFPIHFPVNKI